MMKNYEETCKALGVHKFTLFRYLRELKLKKKFDENRQRVFDASDIKELMKFKQSRKSGRPKSENKNKSGGNQGELPLNNLKLGLI